MTQLMNFFQQMGIENNISVLSFLGILLVSLSSSFILAGIYSYVGEKTALSETGIFRVIPSLALAMTTIFCILQFSMPLSLGLLGSLSIVRYRNPIKNPLDIGFILLTIAISLLSATSNFIFVAILLLLTFLLGLVWLKPRIVGKYLNKSSKVIITAKIPKQLYLESEKKIKDELDNIYFHSALVQSISEENDHLHVCFSAISDSKSNYANLKKIFSDECEVNIYYES